MPQVRGPASQSGKGGAKTNVADASAQRSELQFDDNRLLADLLGEFDSHLSLLENKLGVQVVVRGNVIRIEGPESDREVAKEVLEELYNRLKSGHTIGLGDVDGAIRHVRAGTKLQPKAPGNGPEVGKLRTRKRLIAARALCKRAIFRFCNPKS